MAKQRIDMRKVRELLRLHFERGITSVRELSKLSNVGKTTVSDYLNGFKRSGLAYSQISALSDSELTAAIHGSQKTANPK